MAQALFVTTKDIATFTPINGNVDVDKIVPSIKVGQDIHIQNYLGTDLFDKINDDIVASTLTGNYLTLVNKYIKPMVFWFGFYEYLKFAPYEIDNKGIFKHISENSNGADTSEVDSLEGKALIIAEHYTKRFTDFICFNSADYPEYNTNSNGDMYPDRDVNFTNWFL
jgi:hypothetical protein